MEQMRDEIISPIYGMFIRKYVFLFPLQVLEI